MGFADNLRKELNGTNEEIIATRFEPNKERAMGILAEGIKRIGYVCIDTLCGTSSYEGNQLSSALGSIKNKDLDALHQWLTREGFKVSKMWWGYSSDGLPDMVKIRV